MPKFDSWKEGSVARRNERQAKPQVRARPQRAKKDTRRWCRGKEGVEHKLVTMKFDLVAKFGVKGGIFKDWLLRFCTVCGKEVAHYYHFGKQKKDPPEWVKKFREENKK